MTGLEKPPFGGGVDALRAYLCRLCEQLEWALEELERIVKEGEGKNVGQ